MVLVLFKGTRTQKVNLKTSIKGILYDFEKKMKNFIFQFFDENLLLAWFKDERPQELKGLTMIFAGQKNPFIIFRSKEILHIFQNK